MRHIHLLNVVAFSLAFILLKHGSTVAEPILLAEWRREVNGFFEMGSTPPTIPFRFRATLDLTPGNPFDPIFEGSWTQQIGHADVGQTYEAPTEVVNGFVRPFMSDQVHFGGGVGTFASMDFSASLSTWQNAPSSYTQHVTLLSDYRITAISRTVDSLVLQPTSAGQNHLEGGKQTIRLYGELIPPLPGDYNKDGLVDAADYVVWRDRVADFAPMPNGSGQGIFQGIALPQDYDYWRANYGLISSLGPLPAVVPEPATYWLVLICGLKFVVRRIPPRAVGPNIVGGILWCGALPTRR